jgi:hypothetical protein
VLASLLALTLGGATFASANFFQFQLNWIPLVGYTPPQTNPPCSGTGTVDTAWDPNAPSNDPAANPNTPPGAFVIVGVHITVTSPPGTTNTCVGRTADWVLTGGGAPYPFPDDAAHGGPKLVGAGGTADWTWPVTLAPTLPDGSFGGVIVSIT